MKNPTLISFYTLLTFMLLSVALEAQAAPSGRGRVTIDDQPYDVVWSDGDSFRITTGTKRGQRVRLMGYNTLESYGPVHKWGDWNEWSLYKIAKNAKGLAASEHWECNSQGKVDRYKRLLVRCPRLIKAMIQSGTAHLFEVKGKPLDEDLKLQAEAIKARRGMWAKGAPEGVITSVHSQDEKPDEPSYNRVASLSTGMGNKLLHTDTHAVCKWVCSQGSCMRYVPYQLRYGDKRPDCLKWKPRD